MRHGERSGGRWFGLGERRHAVITVLVCVAGVLVAFDDIAPLRALAGTFGASLAWVPLLLCALLLPSDRDSMWPRALIVLFGTGVIVTAITFFVLPSESKGVNLYFKALAVGIPIAVFFAIMVVAGRLAAYRPSLITLFGLVSLGMLVLFGALDLLGVIPRNDVWFLHGIENLNQRARGGRFEASALGAGVLVALATATLRVRNKAWALGIGVVAGVLAYLMPSRGTLVAGMAFCAAIFGAILLHWLVPRVGRWANVAPGGVLVVVTLLGGFGLGALVTAPQWAGMSYSSSDAVRSVWGDASMDAALDHPVGMGFSAPLEWLPNYVRGSMEQFDDSFSPSDFTELNDQLNADGSYGFSPKTMPSLLGVYFGAAGVLALIAIWLAIGRRVADAWRAGYFMVGPAALALSVTAASYFSSIYAWEQAFILGALLGVPHMLRNDGPDLTLPTGRTPVRHALGKRWLLGPSRAGTRSERVTA
ncbi:hypothetical protein ACIBCL_03295 [Micromonospora zamorensis]|uniref:hypothetical protein n=1 Tax=Micromonospora zamorensis TaxID=709883 RepID=UPI0037A0AFAD